MKKCPFCAEEILSEAKTCKHCGKNISETEKPFYKKNIGTGKILFWLVFILLVFWFYNWINGEFQRDVQRYQGQLNQPNNIISQDKILEINPISTQPIGNTMAEVKIKITNLTNKDISSAQVTCVLENKEGQEIGFQKHYIIKSTENGLGAYQSTYFTYIIDVPNNNNIGKFKFNIDELDYK